MRDDTLDKKKMGQRIRAAREARHWTREELAEKVELSVNTMAEIELGRNGTRLENFIRLCRLLDLSADYVLFGAPGDAVQRITDLLRDRDEETVRVVERTVEALLRALDEQRTT
ncbi:helix-turn-helix transcriptional regulator [uncultured Oscillibacter sp.]|uniref:helix-turn-helix transcriptional regulator n=1 Tax=uncultured Oscillibacter sp. TaxID=876091 RepID=UPI003456C5EB